MKKNKYNYLLVIQQSFGYGWEDVDSFDTKETERNEISKCYREYKLMGYPTRIISRRELNTD